MRHTGNSIRHCHGNFCRGSFPNAPAVRRYLRRRLAYLYPLYNARISIFSMMDTGFAEAGLFKYLIVSFVSVFCVFVVILMTLFALNKFGFGLGYGAEK